MLPQISIPVLGSFSVNLMLSCLSLFLSIGLSFLFLKDLFSKRKLAFLNIGVFISAVVGARLFHVVFEMPDYYWQHPREIFTNLHGMTFYGALLTGALFLYLSLKFFKLSSFQSNKVFDIASIIVAVIYGFMRLGCFCNGCCWGKISAVPWAVVYRNPASVMPYFGIPVHPVQLYDSLLGFSMALLFYRLIQHDFWKGKILSLFCLLYPVGRFVTEEFRGDQFRGTDLIFHLSTSQLISVVIFTVGLLHFIRSIRCYLK